MAAYCIENAWHINCNSDIAIPLKFTVMFLVFLLIDEKRNVLYVEFESLYI